MPKFGDLSYCGFFARRLRRPHITYKSQGITLLSDDHLLQRYAWMLPASQDEHACSADRRFFYGERYGGRGTGVHGGGVRCGTDFSATVKGIGCNPLRGEGAPTDYSHGGMSLFECVQEAIWGEVLNIALPFGATKVLAIIDTGSQCWWVGERWGEEALRERYGAPPDLPRGLVIRELDVRPAHFMRAPLHAARSRSDQAMSRDVMRVRQAMGYLIENIPFDCRRASVPKATQENLIAGLQSFARRLAVQSVAAKYKRLLHGNITASNVCMDGRWIDFGSTTAVPGWGDVRGYGSFGGDSCVYEGIFEEFSFNVAKYNGMLRVGASELAAILTAHYREEHSRQVLLRSLCILGFSHRQAELLSSIPDAAILGEYVGSLLRRGYGKPTSAHPDEHQRLGGLGAGEQILSLIRGAVLGEDVALPHGSGVASALGRICDRLTSGQGAPLNRSSLGRLMLLRARKVMRPIPALYRENMVRKTERTLLEARHSVEGERVVSAILADVLEEAELLLSDEDSETSVLLLRKSGASIRFNAQNGEFDCINGEGSIGSACSQHEELMRRMGEYWGASVESLVKEGEHEIT